MEGAGGRADTGTGGQAATDSGTGIELTIPRLLYECLKMGWKPGEFYAETLSDIQMAIAAHYDRVEYEQRQQMTLARRMTWWIVNTGGFLKREVSESEILELPDEREDRLKQREQERFTPEEVKERLERWAREGPGIEGGEDASRILMALAK